MATQLYWNTHCRQIPTKWMISSEELLTSRRTNCSHFVRLYVEVMMIETVAALRGRVYGGKEAVRQCDKSAALLGSSRFTFLQILFSDVTNPL